ncbi:hypothetical protein HK405_012540, partial [Cladochytrium tenue]
MSRAALAALASMATSSGPPIVVPPPPPLPSVTPSLYLSSKTPLPNLLDHTLKEIVIVTSRGTFIVKCREDATVAWALSSATDLMMSGAARPMDGQGDGSDTPSDRDPLVAARTADGSVARDDEKIFDVCKENKILFAITADEITNIPPAFQGAFNPGSSGAVYEAPVARSSRRRRTLAKIDAAGVLATADLLPGSQSSARASKAPEPRVPPLRGPESTESAVSVITAASAPSSASSTAPSPQVPPSPSVSAIPPHVRKDRGSFSLNPRVSMALDSVLDDLNSMVA